MVAAGIIAREEETREGDVPLEIIEVHPEDVTVLVERGVADLGVARTEVLRESSFRVYRPYTFPQGEKMFAFATYGDGDLMEKPRLRVATRYRRIARDFFAERGHLVDLIVLSGETLKVPELGLADAVLDLARDEETLQQYGLFLREEVHTSRLKLIANRASRRARMDYIERVVQQLVTFYPREGGGLL